MIMLILNFGMLAGVFGNVFSLVGASDMIVALMEYEPKVNTQGGSRMEGHEIKGNLTLEEVKFRYPSKPDVQVLKGIDIDVDSTKKRVIALCGQSGCGKSSIIAMLERFYDPDEG